MITKKARAARLREEARVQAERAELGLLPIVSITCLLDMDDIYDEPVSWLDGGVTARIMALLFAAQLLEGHK